MEYQYTSEIDANSDYIAREQGHCPLCLKTKITYQDAIAMHNGIRCICACCSAIIAIRGFQLVVEGFRRG